MAFFSLPAKAESLVHTIHEFQYDTSNKRVFLIEFILQAFVDRIAATEPINPPLLDIPKRKTRVAVSASSYFYDSSYLIDADMFFEVVIYFEEIIANSQTIDSSLQQLIISVVTFTVAIAVTSIQAKHDNEILSLWDMIAKFLLVIESPSFSS